jgi:hypothetical protein
MSKPKGRNFSISPFRQLVTDLMHFSAKVPSVCMDREMNLDRICAARQNCHPRPCWTAIFTKAFGLAAARIPDLRRSYLEFPWPHLYEHPTSVATINLERHWADEHVVFHAQINAPENRPLRELDDLVRYYKEEPVDHVKCFRRIMRMTKVPWPFRRPLFWSALNVFARRRVHNFGTFGISSTSAHGAGIMKLVPLLTSTLHYSLFDEDNSLQMRMSFDHRVLDGSTAAQSLKMLEEVLNNEVLNELISLRFARAA